MPKFISQDNISHLIVHLKKTYDVFGPVFDDGDVNFRQIDKSANIALNYETTILPPKIYFLPPEEELFQVINGEVEEVEITRQFVVFGINIRDLSAIVQLDGIMAKEPADTFYKRRREMSTLIAVSEQCAGVFAGGDLILEKADGSGYRATALTEKGRKIFNLDLFSNDKSPGFSPGMRAESSEKTGERLQPKKTSTRFEKMILDSELLARAVEWSRENYAQIWEKLGKLCIGCGICTYVCPLCYCTTMEDKVSFDKSKCSRCRIWDACTISGFSQIAGVHEFRKTQKDRYFNWFYHKFVRAYKEFGQAQCTACGRCQKYCPAGIDIEEVLEEIIAEFKKSDPQENV